MRNGAASGWAGAPNTEVTMGLSINLEGKVALVTGASSGLGTRFSNVLASAGAKVVLASRRVERLKELRASIEADGGSAWCSST
jgi:NADP-dependent 3-hydroxy acid dehydrogenase YdfG